MEKIDYIKEFTLMKKNAKKHLSVVKKMESNLLKVISICDTQLDKEKKHRKYLGK